MKFKVTLVCTQFHFISLVTPLRINKGKNTFKVSVVPWNLEKSNERFLKSQNMTKYWNWQQRNRRSSNRKIFQKTRHFFSILKFFSHWLFDRAEYHRSFYSFFNLEKQQIFGPIHILILLPILNPTNRIPANDVAIRSILSSRQVYSRDRKQGREKYYDRRLEFFYFWLKLVGNVKSFCKHFSKNTATRTAHVKYGHVRINTDA